MKENRYSSVYVAGFTMEKKTLSSTQYKSVKKLGSSSDTEATF